MIFEITYADLVHQKFFCGMVPLSLKSAIEQFAEEMYQCWLDQRAAEDGRQHMTATIQAEGRNYSVMFRFQQKTTKRKTIELWILHVY